jgi:peptidylprolyl isomerase/peptidyl-prolyl cis-trans isomerase A (cyclophilin A)
MKNFFLVFGGSAIIIALAYFVLSENTTKVENNTTNTTISNNEQTINNINIQESQNKTEIKNTEISNANLQNINNNVQSEMKNEIKNKIMTDFTKQDIIKVTMNTNMGRVVLELDNKKAPITAQNFAKLASEGFYNGIKFHRVINGFMIQGGDPFTKDDSKENMWGQGGPGYKFADEKSGLSNAPMTISMANAGPNTNGSQFFINTGNNVFLDGKHTVFGKVVSGIDVVKKIESVKTGFQDRPESPVVVNSVSVE